MLYNYVLFAITSFTFTMPHIFLKVQYVYTGFTIKVPNFYLPPSKKKKSISVATPLKFRLGY